MISVVPKVMQGQVTAYGLLVARPRTWNIITESRRVRFYPSGWHDDGGKPMFTTDTFNWRVA